MKPSLVVSLSLTSLLSVAVFATAFLTRSRDSGREETTASARTAKVKPLVPAESLLQELAGDEYTIYCQGRIASGKPVHYRIYLLKEIAYQFRFLSNYKHDEISLRVLDPENRSVATRKAHASRSGIALVAPSESASFTLVVDANLDEFVEADFVLGYRQMGRKESAGSWARESGIETAAGPVPEVKPRDDEPIAAGASSPDSESGRLDSHLFSNKGSGGPGSGSAPAAPPRQLLPTVTDIYFMMSNIDYCDWDRLADSDYVLNLLPADTAGRGRAFVLGCHVSEAFMQIEADSYDGVYKMLQALSEDSSALNIDWAVRPFMPVLEQALFNRDMVGLRLSLEQFRSKLEQILSGFPNKNLVVLAKLGAWNRALYALIQADIHRGYIDEESAKRFQDQGDLGHIFLNDPDVQKALGESNAKYLRDLSDSLSRMEAGDLQHPSLAVRHFAHDLEKLIKHTSDLTGA